MKDKELRKIGTYDVVLESKIQLLMLKYKCISYEIKDKVFPLGVNYGPEGNEQAEAEYRRGLVLYTNSSQPLNDFWMEFLEVEKRISKIRV